MKKLFVSALAMLAVALGFTACSSEDEFVKETPAQGKKVTVIATTEEPAQRTMLGEQGTDGTYPVFWSADDKIKIGGNVFTLQSGDGTSIGEFEGTAPGSGTHIAYYPSTYNGTNWPTEQTYVNGNIPQCTPMNAEVVVEDDVISPISFKNEGGILRLNLKGTAKVKSIKISATGLDAITLNCGEAVQLSETATPFHIAVPGSNGTEEQPGTAYSGLKIEITDDAGAVCTKTLKSDKTITVQRSMITDISLTAKFPPAGSIGTAIATISSVETPVKWVQLWEGGPKFAEYNIGASGATGTGTPMTFTDATKSGADYVWGANWRTPNKEEMDELWLATQEEDEAKVICEYTQEGGIYGFKFTGKGAYADNSVFFPAADLASDSESGQAAYWSGTADGAGLCYMYLYYFGGNCWDSMWITNGKNGEYYLVRPVLVETPASNQINGHDYVVLAGYKWATENVGYVNEVEASATDATYGYYYTQAYAEAAAMSWGGTWELPTQDQWEALMDKNNCTWTWTNQDGKDGYKVSDKNDDSKFIFLPAAGFYDDYDVYSQGYDGYYWFTDSRYLYFYDGLRSISDDGDPNYGMAVRPVSR